MRWARYLLALGVVVGVTGCNFVDEKKLHPRCPNFLLLAHAERMTKFNDGPGHDITDVDFSTKITNFMGSCDHTISGIEAELFVEISVHRGPGNRSRKASFEYFIAIPRFHPAPAGKKILRITVKFNEKKNQLVYRDRIYLGIPLGHKDIAANYDVYLGFQLTGKQLKFNRRRPAR